MKHCVKRCIFRQREPAAFGRLCVETITKLIKQNHRLFQPPSGGCVLKLEAKIVCIEIVTPAAFGRLCVETIYGISPTIYYGPAAFGRLCVETF